MDYARKGNIFETVKNKCSRNNSNVLLVFTVLICILLCIFSILLTPKLVVGSSMYPTLNYVEGSNDVVYILKQRTYRRGDIVVLQKNATQSSTDAIKRIIAIEGDKVCIKQDSDGVYKVFINDVALQEKYISSADDMVHCYYNFISYLINNNIAKDYIIVKQNQVFVLGDNRYNSYDSSSYGTRSVKEIEGKVVFIVPQNFKIFKLWFAK